MYGRFKRNQPNPFIQAWKCKDFRTVIKTLKLTITNKSFYLNVFGIANTKQELMTRLLISRITNKN